MIIMLSPVSLWKGNQNKRRNNFGIDDKSLSLLNGSVFQWVSSIIYTLTLLLFPVVHGMYLG